MEEVIELHSVAVDLLNHLEEVLDEENFEKIDPKLWNAVSMFLVNNGINVKRRYQHEHVAPVK